MEDTQGTNGQQYSGKDSQTKTAMYKQGNNEVLYNYIVTNMNNISDLKLRLREETYAATFDGTMLSAPDQCEHMKFLV